MKQEQEGNQEEDEHDPSMLPSMEALSDPYAILNVERDADDESIQRSYKRLSRTFHPDKHPPGLARDAAQDAFVSFKNAHDVLTDPVQRQAFDDHGPRALEVVKRSMHQKHPDALYATLLKLHQSGRKEQARLVLKETLQHLEFEASNRDVDFSASMEFPCTTVSTEFLGEGEEEFFLVPELVGAHASFSVTSSSRPDSKWSLTMGGTTNVVNGKGDASGEISLEYRPVQDTHVNAGLGVSDPYEMAVGTTRRFSNGTVVTSKMRTMPNTKNLGLMFMSQRSLFDNTYVGTCAFAMGTDLTLQLYQLSFMTLWRDWPQITVKFKLGDPHPIKVSAKKKFGNQQHKHMAHASCAFSLSSIDLKAVVDHAVTSYATWSIGIQHATLSGLTWILGVRRGDVSFRIPIFVSTIGSPGYSYKVLLLTFVSALWHSAIRESVEDTASRMILDPQPPKERTTLLKRESSWLELDKSKRDAEQQTLLMSKTAEMSKEVERSLDKGLIILQATYSVDGGESMDATVQLQFWVKNSCLRLPPTPKSHLLGFYSLTAAMDSDGDEAMWWWQPLKRFMFGEESNKETAQPIPGLYVRYECGGRVYETTVSDEEELFLPNSNALCLGESGVVT